jgi:hypothetical protein
MDSGMNVARFNFSHGDHKSHGEVLDRLRKVASEKSRNIAGTFCNPNRSRKTIKIWEKLSAHSH